MLLLVLVVVTLALVLFPVPVPCSLFMSALLFSTCTYNCLQPVAAAATLLQLGRPFTSASRKSRNKLKSNLL